MRSRDLLTGFVGFLIVASSLHASSDDPKGLGIVDDSFKQGGERDRSDSMVVPKPAGRRSPVHGDTALVVACRAAGSSPQNCQLVLPANKSNNALVASEDLSGSPSRKPGISSGNIGSSGGGRHAGTSGKSHGRNIGSSGGG